VRGLIGRCGDLPTRAKLSAMNTALIRTRTSTQLPTRDALRGVRRLVGCYLAVSVAAVVAMVLLRQDAAAVNDAVWTRGILVVVSALLTNLFAARAAGGSRRAFLRLRIVSVVMVVAIAVIIALPGMFPLWLKVEQGVCGLLLLGVALLVNGGRLRSVFAAG
jgi:hypothetical protein